MIVAVAMPVPVIVTVPVALLVLVWPVYCTLMVQLEPGLTTAPETQVPPAGIEKVPFPVPVLAMVGFAVSVNGPVAVAELATVMVPVFVVVLPGVVVNAGLVKATVAPVTVNAAARAGVAPIGVVTVRFLAVSAAPAVMAQVALTVVAVEVMPVQVMPVPEKVTAVAPVRLVPASATGTLVPRSPDVGAIDVTVGPSTVKGCVPLVPDPVVMVTVLVVVAAVAETVKVAVAVSGLMTVRPLTVTPAPLTATLVAPVRLVPVSVTPNDVPRTPVEGATEANVGAGRAMTVKGTALLVPPGAVTVTFLAEPAAVELIVKVALTCASVTTVMPVTVTPPPDTVTATVPVNPLPKRLTGTDVPRTPWLGETTSSTGPVTV